MPTLTPTPSGLPPGRNRIGRHQKREQPLVVGFGPGLRKEPGIEGWSDAVSLMAATGEVMAVQIPAGDTDPLRDPAERAIEQRRARKAIVANVTKTAHRRMLQVKSRWDGDLIWFAIVP